MTRYLLAALLLCACGNPKPEGDYEAYEDEARIAWDALFELLDEPYGLSGSVCYEAIDNVAVVVTNSYGLSHFGCSPGATGCVSHTFFDTGPLGAYTIGLLEGAGHGVLCETLFQELVHVADHCLARNEPSWPFPGGGHPDALFAWPSDSSLIARLEDAALDGCRYE